MVKPGQQGTGPPAKNAFSALMAGARQTPSKAVAPPAASERRKAPALGGVLNALRRLALDPER